MDSKTRSYNSLCSITIKFIFIWHPSSRMFPSVNLDEIENMEKTEKTSEIKNRQCTKYFNNTEKYIYFLNIYAYRTKASSL